jgi:hypothetical protein
MTLFLAGWMAGLLHTDGSNGSITERFMYLIFNPFYWIFLFSAAWIFYEIVKNIFLFIIGDQIIIDKGEATITKNGKYLFAFQDLECLQIREYTDSENDTDYRLSFVKTDGSKVFIDRSSDKDGIMEFAEEIADFVNKPIKLKT